MRLFEGGILDKITNDEYEKMFQQQTAAATMVNAIQVNNDDENSNENGNGYGDGYDSDEKKEAVDNENRELLQQTTAESKEVDGSTNTKKKESSEKELTALSLQMLQGAFYLLILGYLLALLSFTIEIIQHRMGRSLKIKFRAAISHITQQFHQIRMRINQFL